MSSPNPWMVAMRRGDFETAWQIADSVIAERPSSAACWHLPRHEQWVWDGRRLADQRVLVRCYHGLGDTLQFARFLPALADVCGELTVWVQPTLIPLLQHLSASFGILPLHDGAPDVEYDVDVEIMELGHALRTTLASLPAEVPYFDVAPEARRCASVCVGLVAQAGEWDVRRSVPPELMASLTTLPGVRAFSLQVGPPVPGATDLSSPDILTLAARIAGLDLVVTPDTMIAHLAGALGVPTWTLLPAEADWRWMISRDDSPWYPTMRLFRQPIAGDWQSVICRVRNELTR